MSIVKTGKRPPFHPRFLPSFFHDNNSNIITITSFRRQISASLLQPSMELPKTSPETASGVAGSSSFMSKPKTPLSFRRKSKSDLSSMTLLPSSSTKDKEVPPALTPSVVRKQKRRSHIFPNLTGKSKSDDNNKNGSTELLGSGRTIPIRQGYLYKKSLKSLNKDWKKKYVTLTSDGTLTYHPTLHDYMSDTHGKTIPLKHTTVKVPSKYRLSKVPTGLSNPPTLGTTLNHSISQESSSESGSKSGKKEKKHRRTKSNLGKHSEEDSDGDSEFTIISLENKEWRFDADSSTERQEWVTAIEGQIFSLLQDMESDKSKTTCSADRVTIQRIRGVKGNDRCADCGQPDPVWASLNLGTLICIECSGIHRNLGTHISKVRSLDLDDWSSPQVSVMMSLGNDVINEIFEARMPRGAKPMPSSSRQHKESFIRSKYVAKEYLLPLRVTNSDKLASKQMDQKVMDAVIRGDMQTIVLILSRFPSQVKNTSGLSRNACYPLHVAASAGQLAICQFLIWVSLSLEIIVSNRLTFCHRITLMSMRKTVMEELLYIELLKKGTRKSSRYSSLVAVQSSHHLLQELDSMPCMSWKTTVSTKKRNYSRDTTD